ncbi:DUF6311 domain-containing protein [Comamonas sp.]|uniref:DUF6311 domain-containing protein n=1 Tax=Comamonas sp. TaxID=34028 RepID=UPI0028B00448|nr:DUF6311 domain-containing protein [Comamonas sp.]
MIKNLFRQHGGWLTGLILGLVAFLLVIPVNIVDPANIGWLGIHEDTRTYFLGWDFFRRSPWQYPISANPYYGMDIAGSIFMTDTIPLLAIPLKAFDAVLPTIFQYHGIWLLGCFLLQGVLGWRLASLVTNVFWIRGCVTVLFLFQLPFLSRALGHLPLMAHFLILAALLICIRKHERFQAFWLIIIACAACINAYILLMLLALWFSDLLRRGFQNSTPRKKLFLESIFVLGTAVFFCWQVGYFSVGGGVSAAGNPYGLYRFNLISPIDPNGWSRLIKDFPGGPGDGEGFAYLGLGYIFLILAAGFSVAFGGLKWRELPGNRFLVAVLLLLTIYAITNNIGFSSYSFVIPLPEFLSKFTSVFRAAGRLVWPALYFLLFVVCFVVGARYSRKSGIAIFSIAALLQVFDTSAGWLPVKAQVASAQSSGWNLGLKDSFWETAGRRYQAVRRLPAGNVTPEWSVFGAYANSYHMKTDSIYLARVNYDRLNELNNSNLEMIDSGSYQKDTLYIVSNQILPRVLKSIKPNEDFIGAVDDYVVIAPGWKRDGLPVTHEISADSFVKPVVRGAEYQMTSLKSEGIRTLFDGWDREIGEGGVWSSGGRSLLEFPLGSADFNAIEITGTPLVSAVRPVLQFQLSVNGAAARDIALDGHSPAFTLQLTPFEKAAIARDRLVGITFSYKDPTSPKAIGINGDERIISFAVKQVRFE